MRPSPPIANLQVVRWRAGQLSAQSDTCTLRCLRINRTDVTSTRRHILLLPAIGILAGQLELVRPAVLILNALPERVLLPATHAFPLDEIDLHVASPHVSTGQPLAGGTVIAYAAWYSHSAR